MPLVHDVVYYLGLWLYTDMINYVDLGVFGLCVILHRFGLIKMELVRIFWMSTSIEEENDNDVCSIS